MMAVVCLAVGLGLSCSSGTSRTGPPEPEDPTPPPVSGVKVIKPEILVKSEDGKSSFIVNAKDSEISVTEEGPNYGTLSGVTGSIKRLETLASTFSSNDAQVDRNQHVLTLTGNVVVTGEERGLVLHAESVKYDQGLDRIEAAGSVTVTSATMVLGPMPKLLATPDLKHIATPGKFK